MWLKEKLERLLDGGCHLAMSTTLALVSQFIRIEVEIRRRKDLTLMPAASDLSTARILDFSCVLDL